MTDRNSHRQGRAGTARETSEHREGGRHGREAGRPGGQEDRRAKEKDKWTNAIL